MRPLSLALLLLAALLLAGPSGVLAQKDKQVKANAADKELASAVVGDANEEENEFAGYTEGADKGKADVLEDYAEDSFSYAPALRKDPDNVAPRKRKPGKVPRGKKVGDWYSLRTPKDLLDGLDDGIKKDLSGEGGLCGKKGKNGIDACALPPLPKKKKRRAVPKRPKAIRRPRFFDDEDDDDVTSKKLKKKKYYKPPTEEELADALIPRSQMMALTKKEERKASDEYASLMKGKRRGKAGIPFPGIPIGVDGEKIGRKGFGRKRGRKFYAGREDIMPLGGRRRRSGRKASTAATNAPLHLIDPSELAPLLDGSFMEMESDVIQAFNDASDSVEREDGGEVSEEALVF